METKTLPELEADLVEEFSGFSEWMDKYELLIEKGKELPDIDPEYQTDNYLIKGCQSQVWLAAKYENERVYYFAASDALITRGIVSMLIYVLSGQKTNDIINTQLSFIEKIGLKEHLSPTRANGLLAMIKQMKMYATVFKMKHEQ